MTQPNQLVIGSINFWKNARKSFSKKNFAHLKDGTIHYVVFEDSVKMDPFVRTDEIMFEAHAIAASKTHNYLAAINGQVFDLNTVGLVDYAVGNDPITPDGIDPIGLVVRSKKIITGRQAPLNFFIANDPSRPIKYSFGFGSAPTTSETAIGGAGPLIINGLPYGHFNKYRKGQPKGKIKGEPTPENKKNLIQRSNSTFTAFTKHVAAPRTGITAIAHSSREKMLAIFVHPDNSGAAPLTVFRDRLIAAGFDNAIFLDGSDSSMLIVENNLVSRQAPSKNKTTVVGIGFKY